MANGRSDATLVIRARDEAQKTINAVGDALQRLLGIQDDVSKSGVKTGGSIADLATILKTLDGAYTKIAGSAESAAAALQRQKTAIAEQKNGLAAVQVQAESAARTLSRLNNEANQIGPRVGGLDPLLKQIKLVSQEYDRLDAEASRFARTIATQEAGLSTSASSLQRVSSQANAVEAAVAKARIQVDAQTAALQKQTAAAEANAAVLERVNRLTGVDKGKDVRLAAQLQAEADAAQQVVLRAQQRKAAEDNVRAAIQSQNAELAKQQATLEASVAVRQRIEQITGVNRGDGGSNLARQLLAEQDAAEQIILRAQQRKIAEDAIRAELESQNAALAKQQAAAEAVAAVRQRINQITGIDRGDGGLALAAQLRREEEDALQAVLRAQQKSIQLEEAKAAAQRESLGLQRAKQRAEQDEATRLAADELQQKRANAFLANPGSGKSARDSASVFTAADVEATKAFEKSLNQTRIAAAETARETAGLDAAVERLRAALDPVAAGQRAIAVEQAKLNALFKAGKISTTELAGGLKLLENAGKSQSRLRFLGLKPYELQNLSYQINDVFTQIASGTSITQTFAQQGGQILQLFPRIGSAIAAGLTSVPILLATTALISFGLAVKRAVDNADELRNLQGMLAANADGAIYQADALKQAADALDHYGLSAEDALSVVRTFVKDGFNPARLVEFGQAAQDMADVLGIKVTDAATQLGEAFDGSYDSLKKFDEATNVLSASQLENIRLLFEQGKSQEALALAFDVTSDRFSTGAEQMRGPWASAVRDLSAAWDGFWETLSNSSAAQGTINVLTKLANGVTKVLDAVSGADKLQNLQHQLKMLSGIYEKGVQLTNIDGKQRYQMKPGITRTDQADELNQLLDQIDTINAATEAAAQAAASEQAAVLAEQTAAQAKRDGEALQAAADKYLGEVKITNELIRQQKIQAAYDQALRAAYKQRLSDETAITLAQNARTAAEISTLKELQTYQSSTEGRIQSIVTLIKEFEGYIPKAKFDVNAFRVGYGSDTTTAPDGSVTKVARGTITTEEDALRDLNRRIEEFTNVVKNQLGAERYNSFNPAQQAALVSIAYNYGSLPDRIIRAARTGTSKEIADAVRGLSADNGGVNSKRRNREADILNSPNSSVDNTAKEALDAEKKKQNDLNLSVEQRTRTIEEANAALAAQNGLIGEALIASQRQAAIDKAEADLRKQTEDANKNLKPGEKAVALTEAQIQKTRELTAANFDLAHAKDVAAARRDAVMQPVDDLTAQRDAIQAQIEFNQKQGNNAVVGQLESSLVTVNQRLDEATQKALSFWDAILQGGPSALAQLGLTAEAVENIKLKLETTEQSGKSMGSQFLMTGRQINESFASGAASAFDRFAQAVANGENATEALKNAFLQFASDFLRQIAQMIIQQAIFNAIGGATGGGSGGLGAILSGLIGSAFHHDGGIVGQGGRVGFVNPAIFNQARRMHTGGVAGLAANEVPAVLQKGEEVLTRDDPRHIMNGGGGGRGDVKIVNAFDAGDMLSQGLNTKNGEAAVLNLVRSNPGAFKAALG